MTGSAKIAAKPIYSGDKVNQARDMSGLRKWARESRPFRRVLSFLGWFTIPAEVIFRYRFGQRWFTPMNFYLGAFLLLLVVALQLLSDFVCAIVINFDEAWNPFYTGASMENAYYGSLVMKTIFLCYVLLGIRHLFKRWWRIQTNMDLHSYDDGVSWLEKPAGILMWTINILAWPLIAFYRGSLTKAEKQQFPTPWLIKDRAVFTSTVIEPAIFLFYAFAEPYFFVRLWFFITALAVAIHANLREAAKKTKMLDFRDSMIEAKAMRELKNKMNAAANPIKQPSASNSQKNPPDQHTQPIRYPDLSQLIEQHHQESRAVAAYKAQLKSLNHNILYKNSLLLDIIAGIYLNKAHPKRD